MDQPEKKRLSQHGHVAGLNAGALKTFTDKQLPPQYSLDTSGMETKGKFIQTKNSRDIHSQNVSALSHRDALSKINSRDSKVKQVHIFKNLLASQYIRFK